MGILLELLSFILFLIIAKIITDELKEVSQAISFPKLPVVLSTIISGLIGVESRKISYNQKPMRI